MKSKLLLSLIKSIIQLNKLELKNIDEISSFVNSQINKMPDYFSISVKIISYFFEFIIFFTHFKRFHNLTEIRKVKSLLFIKKNNIIVFSLFIRLIESNILVKYFELSNEK